jgi:membrane-associated phospholipid phosphatase
MPLRILAIFLLASASISLAQVPTGSATAKGTTANGSTSKGSEECGIKAIQICALHVAQDEWGIVTAPLRIRTGDELKIVGFGLGTTLAMATDVNAMQELGVDPSREHNANVYSNFTGIYGPAAAVTVGYFVGSARHNRRLQETSILAEEAMVDSFILNTALGYGIDRQTPTQGNGKGNFWPYGPKTWPDGQSMPSDHSVLAWSFARVVAAEYPGRGTTLGVYTLAASVSAARVIARKHFPSDVFVGGVLGYYIGGYVVRHRATQLPVREFSLSPIRTPNGNGIELSYNFSH